MTRRRASGTFTITGVGQSILDLEGISIPLTGEARLDGIVRQGAVVTVKIPNSLVDVLIRALDRPVEQIPMYRVGLVALSLHRP
jgi:hypothetical protein